MKTNRKIITSIAAASALLAGAEGKTQLLKPENGLEHDYRAGVGYSGNLNDTHRVQTAIGVAPKGSYYLGPVPAVGQFYDTFRLYDINAFNGNGDAHTTLLGAKSPSFSLGDIENKVIAFGALDTQTGAAIETSHTLNKKVNLTLNAEYNMDSNTKRFGGALSYNITDDMRFSLAYDRINGIGNLEQYFANVTFNESERDTIGISGLARVNKDKSVERDIGAFWTNHEEKAPWGTFVHVHYASNDKQESKSFSGNFILAQNPLTSKYGSIWTTGRGVAGDDFYNLSVIPQSVTLTEPIRLFDRAKKGFSFEVRGDYFEQRGIEKTSLAAGVGYIKFYKPINSVFGFTGELRTELSEKGERYTLDSNMIYRGFHPKGLWGFTAGITVPLNAENAKPAVRGAAVIVF